MEVEKVVGVAVEAVAALRVSTCCVETGSEAVELLMKFCATVIQELQSW